MAIASAYVDIKPSFKGIQKETKRGLSGVEAEFDTTGRKSGSRFTRALGGIAKAGAIGVGAAVAAGLGTALTKGFQRLTAIDEAEAKLRGLGHSAQTVEQIMQNSLNAVKGTAFGLDEAATVSAALVASGIKPGKELEGVLTTVADSATIAGIGMDEMGAIFGKVAATGKLQGDELNQLSERGIPALQLLSDHLGITTDEVRTMVSKGQVDFETFAAAMEEGMGGAAQKSGETFTGAWKNVGAALGRIGATLLKPFFEAAKGGTGSLTSVLDGINDALGPVMESFGQWLNSIDWSAFGTMLAPLMDAFKQLGPIFLEAWQSLSPLSLAFEALKPSLPILANAFGQLAQTVAGVLGAALQTLLPVVGQLVGVIGGVLLQVFQAVIPVIVQLAQFLGPVLGTYMRALAPIIGSVVQVVGSLVQALLPVVQVVLGLVMSLLPPLLGLFQAFSPVLIVVGQLVGFLARVIGGVLTVAINILVPILKVLVNILSVVLVAAIKIVTGILNGLAWLVTNVIGPVFVWLYQNAILPAWNGIKIAVAAVVGWFQTYVAPVIRAAINAVGAVFRWLYQNIVIPVFNGIRMYITSWWTGVKMIFTAVVTFVKAVLGPVFQLLWAIIKVVWNGIKLAIQSAWNAVIKPVWNAIVSFINSWLVPRFNFLMAVVKTVWAVIKSAINSAWQFIKTYVFSPIVAFIRDVLQPRFNFLLATVRTVWTSIHSKIRAVWDAIKSKVFDPLAHVVKNALPKAFEAGKNAIGKAWNGLKALARKPVAFVVETIVRDGLVKPFNKIAGVFGTDKIDTKLFTVPKLRTGGPVPGSSPSATADNIPIWATAGEFMVRRRSADRLRRRQPGMLEHINAHGEVPGYKSGGDIVALGKALQGIGVRVSEHPKFGGVSPVHSKNSWHYRAGALDLNTAAGQSKGEMSFFDKLMPILQGLGWGTIWRYPNHYGHAHVDMGGRKLGNFKSGGIGNLLAKGLFGALKGLKAAGGAVGNALVDLNPFKGLIDKITKGVGDNPFAQMIGGGAKNLVNKAIDWMTEKMPFGGDTGDINDPGGQGAGVGRWTDTVKRALTMLGQPTSGGMVNTVLRRLKQESGGNPKAINNWDSNARAGNASRGLMQVIPPTFRAYAMKGFGSNIWDPLSNILASMRYALSRYGSLSAAYNRKGGYADGGTITPTLYDQGGWLQPGLTSVLNATGKPEAVFTPDQLSMLDGGGPRWNIEKLSVSDPDEFVRAVDARERKREILSPL